LKKKEKISLLELTALVRLRQIQSGLSRYLMGISAVFYLEVGIEISTYQKLKE